MDSQTQLTALQWAIQQGGAYVVILVVLFFYRRDWQVVVQSQKEQLTVLTALIVENTKAQTMTAAAVAQSNVVSHKMTRVMEAIAPFRRDSDRSVEYDQREAELRQQESLARRRGAGEQV